MNVRFIDRLESTTNRCVFQCSKLNESLENSLQKLEESKQLLKTNENGMEYLPFVVLQPSYH